MVDNDVFESETLLPNRKLSDRTKSLLGFEERYQRIRAQLELLLRLDELDAWSKKHHKGNLAAAVEIAEQYPLVIFFGDVGTGKSVMAECLANRLVSDSGVEDCTLFKLSNRVRGEGKVGQMGTLLSGAIARVVSAAGKRRRSVLIIDEGDSLASARSSDNSHHEDKVAVNTLIQGIDQLRGLGGRVVVILCTNRASVLDPAIQRRAAIMEEFTRPDAKARRRLFEMDLAGLEPDANRLAALIEATGEKPGQPGWTYSDIRGRLYPAAIARAFPNRGLDWDDLIGVAASIAPSPVVIDR